jgi:anti-sigma B factor antagonist
MTRLDHDHPRRPAPFDLRGEIDLATAVEVGRQLERYGATTTGEVAVNCHELRFIDSTGLSALIKVRAQLDQTGRGIVLLNLPRNSGRVFEISGVDQLFRIEWEPVDEEIRRPPE